MSSAIKFYKQIKIKIKTVDFLKINYLNKWLLIIYFLNQTANKYIFSILKIPLQKNTNKKYL